MGEFNAHIFGLARWPDAAAFAAFANDAELEALTLSQRHLRVSETEVEGFQPSPSRDGEIFLLSALRLVPGVTFAECRAQMSAIVDVAEQYQGRPLQPYRVDSTADDEHPDLLGMTAWPSTSAFFRFAAKLQRRSLIDRMFGRQAHELSPESATLVQARALPLPADR